MEQGDICYVKQFPSGSCRGGIVSCSTFYSLTSQHSVLYVIRCSPNSCQVNKCSGEGKEKEEEGEEYRLDMEERLRWEK